MAKFTVDTRLFRELGELLVGRDSTALVELVKNAYDADATSVTVYGERLEDLSRGFIQVTDNGLGMSEEEFLQGFLRIASRSRVDGKRTSRRYGRRYTGAKGIGRLAAHKLAKLVQVYSVCESQPASDIWQAVDAAIDWDAVEAHETLDQVEAPAVAVETPEVPAKARSGTTITLRRLRRRWTQTELGRFIAEVQNFEPPAALVSPPPPQALAASPLFGQLVVRDTGGKDPGFHVNLEGDFSGGEDYWKALIEASHWIIEIDASAGRSVVKYSITPTQKTCEELPDADQRTFDLQHPSPQQGPFFQSRILVRIGGMRGPRLVRDWVNSAAGIRVFLEGFRVLPYGERRDDWLSIDYDYTRRARWLPFLDAPELAAQLPDAVEDKDAALSILPNSNYFGAVFLTERGSSSLRMLVNREGFVPEAGYEHLVSLVRTGIDLSVKVRAAATVESREARRKRRAAPRVAPLEATSEESSVFSRQESLRTHLERAGGLVADAKELAAEGDFSAASRKFTGAEDDLKEAARISEELISEASMLRVLASVGTQMAAFIHEINGLLGMTGPLESTISRIKEARALPKPLKRDLGRLHGSVGDLRRNLERQASYLVDVVTPDARRRRSRQSLTDRFDAGRKLIDHLAERRSIEVRNEIPPDLKSPPMFPAELTAIFANLLTNAVKAAGTEGTILARGTQTDGRVRLVIENTGVAVDLKTSERWFRPFESTTATVDPVLGQGMGLGLPITRNILEDYGGEIRFVAPSGGYATAIEIVLPG
jgi:signal transduction histidine kinase